MSTTTCVHGETMNTTDLDTTLSAPASSILTHCIRNRLYHTMYWKSPISSLGRWGYEIKIFLEKNGWSMCKQWRPWSAASDLGLHCLPDTLLGVSRLQWVKEWDTPLARSCNPSAILHFGENFVKIPPQLETLSIFKGQFKVYSS